MSHCKSTLFQVKYDLEMYVSSSAVSLSNSIFWYFTPPFSYILEANNIAYVSLHSIHMITLVGS